MRKWWVGLSLGITGIVLCSPASAYESTGMEYESTELPGEPVRPSETILGASESDLWAVIKQGLCVEWTAMAMSAGWPVKDLPQLMRIMFRESRCIPTACGVTDSPHIRKCRDWGLMQINDYSWKRIVRSLGLEMGQMHDPYWNLWFARWLFTYSEQYSPGGCGWAQWMVKCRD